MSNYEAIIVGAGFAGAVMARQMANLGKKVLVVEKRAQIGGNMYECYDKNDIRVHLYGPHIFHTNDEGVYEFLKQYSEFYPYEHKVIGKIDGQLVPIPFNYKSLEMLFSETESSIIKEKLKEYFGGQAKVSILDLISHQDEVIKNFGQYVYEKVFVNYTAKQWGIPIEQVDKSVINRVPVILGYDDRYFGDKIQYMPKDGFTKLFENMLDHENIEIRLNTNILNLIEIKEHEVLFEGESYSNPLIFTGAVDELLKYKYGKLPYRSLDLKFEQYEKELYQTNSVVNYPNEEEFTRITEFKYLTNQEDLNNTTILKEYPLNYSGDNKEIEPYYPIINNENMEIYNKYKSEIAEYKNIYLIGRLAEYKYYNMDAVVRSALDLFEEIL